MTIQFADIILTIEYLECLKMFHRVKSEHARGIINYDYQDMDEINDVDGTKPFGFVGKIRLSHKRRTSITGH